MNNQNLQQTQNLKQAQGHASDCKYTVEVKRDDSAQIQKKEQSVFNPVEQIAKGQPISQSIEQKKGDAGEEMQKPKRPRKTIEQELAELDAKRQKLIEKKRTQDVHKKIIFGAASIKVLKIFCHKEENQKEWEKWKDELRKVVMLKDKNILDEVINEIED